MWFKTTAEYGGGSSDVWWKSVPQTSGCNRKRCVADSGQTSTSNVQRRWWGRTVIVWLESLLVDSSSQMVGWRQTMLTFVCQSHVILYNSIYYIGFHGQSVCLLHGAGAFLPLIIHRSVCFDQEWSASLRLNFESAFVSVSSRQITERLVPVPNIS